MPWGAPDDGLDALAPGGVFGPPDGPLLDFGVFAASRVSHHCPLLLIIDVLFEFLKSCLCAGAFP